MIARAEITAVLEGIADIMQIKGEVRGKVQAYRWAARVLDTLQEDIHLLYQRNELTNLPGIGASILEKIKELIETGRCEYYEELKTSIPAGVLDLMSISGVGPSTAAKLYHELNIVSLEALREALDAQKLRGLKGMGKKTQEKIRTGLSALMRYRQYRLMGHVLPYAQMVVNALASLEDVGEISLAGDLRRRVETVSNVEIVAACGNKGVLANKLLRIDTLAQAFPSLSTGEELALNPLIETVRGKGQDGDDKVQKFKSFRVKGNDDCIGTTTYSVVLRAPTGDVEFHVRLTTSEEFATALVYFTGSEGHITQLNDMARQHGLEPLLPEALPAWAKKASEDEIYAALGLPFIVPELREGKGEIEAALAGGLPKLIDMSDIRGDLHVHSTWSDGNETIETMAEAARGLGYEYIAICDHSISSKIANGLSVERILSKLEAVRELNEKIPGIKILMGSEVDVLKDGALDYPDEILAKLDVVIAGVHSGFNMDEARMTERIIKAIENRFVHILAHPTGRLLNRRDPYQVNIGAIIDAAAANNIALEINAYPERLDLRDIHARQAKGRGVKMAINTDAHSIADLSFLVYGVYTARRGWLEKKDVLNALPLAEIVRWLRGSVIFG